MDTKKICIRQSPKGVPDPDSDFAVESVRLPTLEKGEILIEAEWISVDPYLRGRIRGWDVGHVIESGQVAKVIQSRDPDYMEGEYVFGYFQWATRSVVKAKNIDYKVPSDAPFSRSHYIGAYGMPGKTAWYGMIEVAKLKHCENVFVSGAAGAVGSYVAQIAKLYDCHVVGICGSEAKCKHLVEKLGVDVALNYKSFNNDSSALQARLKEVFPKGIDLYFDNTGGFITAAVWDVLNFKARVIICGQIANYNRQSPKVDDFLGKLIYKEISIQGIIVFEFRDQKQFNVTMKRWIQEKKIHAHQTVVQGFDNVPKAFVGLFSGENIGKMVVYCGSGPIEKEEDEAKDQNTN